MTLWRKQKTWTDLLPVTRKRRSRFGFPADRWGSMAAGAGIGACVMYYTDPERGRRRRKNATDRSMAVLRKLSRQLMRFERRKAAHISGAVIGLLHYRDEPDEIANNQMLADRIRSQAFREFDFPHGQINLNVENRVAVLRGVLEQPEYINRVEKAVQRIPGVAHVESYLHLPNTPPAGG